MVFESLCHYQPMLAAGKYPYHETDNKYYNADNGENIFHMNLNFKSIFKNGYQS